MARCEGAAKGKRCRVQDGAGETDKHEQRVSYTHTITRSGSGRITRPMNALLGGALDLSVSASA